VLDDAEGGALDLRHDLVDLDRVRQVMDEVDQRHQADEQQHDRAGHREPREAADPFAARDADRVEPGRAVGEGRDEDAEHDLVRPVAQEAVQQSRRELGRRQLQCDHGQTEHHRDHGGHRAGDRDQQRTSVVRRPLEEHPAERRVR
jgi:hypothetical protein